MQSSVESVRIAIKLPPIYPSVEGMQSWMLPMTTFPYFLRQSGARLFVIAAQNGECLPAMFQLYLWLIDCT